MKTSKSMPRASTGHHGRAVAFTLLIAGIIPLGVQAAPEPESALTLYQTVDNGTELSCSFDIPATGSGAVVRFRPRDADSKCEGNKDDEKDKLFQPHSIRIRYAPAATRFILTEKKIDFPEPRCSKEGAWIELETTRPLSSLEKMGLDKITDYRGYIVNIGSDTQARRHAGTQARSIGFKLVDYKGNIPQGKLSCIEVTTSHAAYSGGK